MSTLRYNRELGQVEFYSNVPGYFAVTYAMEGTYGDVQALMRPILRHRILLNFQAESDKLKADDLLQKIIDSMPVPKE